jgi:hypothetical protein
VEVQLIRGSFQTSESSRDGEVCVLYEEGRGGENGGLGWDVCGGWWMSMGVLSGRSSEHGWSVK